MAEPEIGENANLRPRVCKRKVSPAHTLSLDFDPWEQVGGADKYEFRVFVQAF